ncbi:MAG: SDR family oxidoreductase [Rhodococcus sp.]|nr:SDR family oxidoreductase [Rhodococcus sp. (in: high G+C Gram-positive bacteria)]
MATYIVTGGTGFLGRNVLPVLLGRDPHAEIHVLVRRSSVHKLEQITRTLDGGNRVHALIGDLTEPGLGIENPPPAEHILHLGAIYDLTVGDEQAATNVEGTQRVIDLALKLDATMHHVSSVAVAGDYVGEFREEDFDNGQGFPTAYHRTKFEAEKLVRETDGLRWRVYRPSAVVGHSVTGEIDKIDGPYYLFPSLKALGHLPTALPMAVPDLGGTNMVPVDYVAAATVELMLAPGRDGQAFHLVNPTPQPMREVYAALASAAGAPAPVADLPGSLVKPFLQPLPVDALEKARRIAFKKMGAPVELLDNMALPTVFINEQTREALAGTGIEVPPLADYVQVLWDYWLANLDRSHRSRKSLDGRIVVITGASSGIGHFSAIAAAKKGATVLLLARRVDELNAVVEQIRADGGSAYGYPCDITDSEDVDQTVKKILDEHGHVDMLVNNAGRSIRRGLYYSTDRLHDFERTMAVNYFGAVRMVLALLPQMRQRRFGHIVNISSAGVQTRTPRFSAYVGSKAALDGFSEAAAAETLSDGITFTTIHMPLVATPMIAPTGEYNVGRIMAPERAAAMVVRALTERPKRIDMPEGTLAEWGHVFAPGIKDRVMNAYHRAFPDSPAAKGQAKPEVEAAPTELPTPRPHQSNPVGTAVRRVARLLPGVHW